MPNTYLTANTGTATNAKKFTLSMWIKRGNLCDTNSQRFYQGYADGNNRFYVMFDNTNSYPDSLWIYAVTGGSTQVYWYSSRKFRDTNGWYHFVFQADSTLGTAADRLKVYVNNVLETSFTKTNNPASNIDWGNQLAQSNNDLTISGTESQTQLFDGYMSHVAFVDGQALAPTEFGETDSTSGIWKFKSPSGITWGNNGYHLKFENSANLGLDSSGEGNNFTVNGDLKQAIDTPSNVYATLNGAFNLSDNVLSYGNNKALNSNSNWKYVPATLGVESGKWYAEYKVNKSSGYSMVGVVDMQYAVSQDQNNYTHTAAGTGGVGIYSDNGERYIESNTSGGSTASYAGTFTTGDIIGVALDMDNNKVYFSKNGDWANGSGAWGSSTFNSSTGAITLPTTGTYTFSVSQRSGAYNETNFGNGYFGNTAITSAGSNGNGSLFEYDVPSGYYALNTKNINTYG